MTHTCPSLSRHARRTATLALLLTILRPLDVRMGGAPNLRQAQPVVACTATPRPAHTIAVGRHPIALALDAQTRRAFVRNSDGTVSVLDLTHDTVLRTVTVSAPAAQPVEGLVENENASALGLAVDMRTARVFVTTGGAITVLDAASGTLLRRVPLGAAPYALTVDEHNNHVFAIRYGNAVSLLDATSGALLHTAHLRRRPRAIAVDQRTARVFVTTYGAAHVVDATSGVQVRSLDGVTPIAEFIGVDEATSRVFLTGRGGGIYISKPGGAVVKSVSMLDARDGTLLRSLGTAQGYHNASASSLVVDEPARRVLIVGGSVSVLDARSGAVLINRHLARHGPGGEATAAAVDARRGCLFVPIAYGEPATNPQSGTVSVVDVATARVVTTIPIGGLLLSATVDPTTEQVLILNRNDPGNPTGPNGSVSVLGPTPPSGHGSGGAPSRSDRLAR
jgi:DNA-binding beta-propeller fold protein YncE